MKRPRVNPSKQTTVSAADTSADGAPLSAWPSFGPNFMEADAPSSLWLALDADKFRGELAREFPALSRHLRRVPCTEWDMLRIARALCIAMGIAPPGNDPVSIGTALEAAGVKLNMDGKRERQARRLLEARAEKQETRDPSRGGRSTPIRARASHLVQAEARRLQNEASSLGKKLPVGTRFKLAVLNVVKELSASPGNALNKRMLKAVFATDPERRNFMGSERVKFINKKKKLLAVVRGAVPPTSSPEPRKR